MKGGDMDSEWLTVEDIAAAVKVDPQTVRRWLRAGQLPGRNFHGRTGWRIRVRDFDAFVGVRADAAEPEHEGTPDDTD
jgi:excisionase family DNA binding protein